MSREIVERSKKLSLNYFGIMCGIAGTDGWNGLSGCIGNGQIYNTSGTQHQFLTALAMSEHPEVDRLIQEGGREEYLNMADLEDKKVLDGLKILDLGCGYRPTFARLTRWLGAEVYTADLIGSEEFEYDPIFHDRETGKSYEKDCPLNLRSAEIDNHIQGDLYKDRTLEEIMKKSGGDFDLVSSSFVRVSDGHFDQEKIAGQMLKEGGVFHEEAESFYRKDKGKLECLHRGFW